MKKMIRHVVQKIRTKYRSDVPIIIKMDSGFFDQKLFGVFEELCVGYVVSGKLYDDIKEYAKKVKREIWQQYQSKDFGHEELPFKKFAPNAAYYYCMVLAFFLFESFKEDVCSEIVNLVAYATTVRRKLIDCAAKIVKTSGKIILKVTFKKVPNIHEMIFLYLS